MELTPEDHPDDVCPTHNNSRKLIDNTLPLIKSIISHKITDAPWDRGGYSDRQTPVGRHVEQAVVVHVYNNVSPVVVIW